MHNWLAVHFTSINIKLYILFYKSVKVNIWKICDSKFILDIFILYIKQCVVSFYCIVKCNLKIILMLVIKSLNMFDSLHYLDKIFAE